MQFASSGTLEEVQAFVSSVIAGAGGQITAAGTAVTSAQFTKKFSWLSFLLLMVLFGAGLIYLVWWFVQKDQSITVTYRTSEGVVYGTITAKGKKAKKAGAQIVSQFRV